MKIQLKSKERVFHIMSNPKHAPNGIKLSDGQIKEAELKIRELFS